MRAILALALASSAFANGIIVETPRPEPLPPVRMKEHRVTAVIHDRAASVTVEQVFVNHSKSVLEGTYLFPLPADAAVGEFAMTMGDRLVEGEVLEAKRAREIYESIVRSRRDPGLLEYAGRGLFRARVFPLEPGKETRVRLTYQQVLPEEAGAVEFSYPLGADSLNRAPLESVIVDVRFESSVDLRSVLCPSHAVDVKREGGRGARVVYEATRRREIREMRLWFGRSADDVALTALSSLPRAGEGTFLASLAPRLVAEEGEAVPKDVVYVLDTSGSMQGAAIEQAKSALKRGIAMLRPGDRFGIVAFSSEARRFRRDATGWPPRDLVEPTEEHVRDATKWIDAQEARGGTALEDGLRTALSMGEKGRLFLVLLLTDGRPTVGFTKPDEILDSAKRSNVAAARVFTFGAGDELDVKLLDRIAEETGGRRHYIAPHEEIGPPVTAFLRSIDQPLLTDVRLDVEGGAEEIYPRRMPDFYAGGEVVLLGRYAKAGERVFRLSGKRRGEERTFEFRTTFSGESRHAYLERIWAQRKIAFLLDEMRLHGENKELADEVTRLAMLHAFVTPYTAGLVLEEETRSGPVFNSSGIGHRLPSGPTTPGDPASPAAAGGSPRKRATTKALFPGQSKDLRDRKEAAVVTEVGAVRAIEDKTFRWTREGRWIDTAWDGKTEPKRIEAWSDDYLALLKTSDLVARYLSVGESVVLVLDGTVYEITSPPPP
ncbi:MAG: VIT domain-containing protein [Planctomycetota bacterium]